mmetsp:Transcript_82778/g.165547  ORF Transcript_82778/g.165547 Transcript_82778/m.165547 type:complete len:207 (-) Transcript_82778:364-984(-)
MPESSLPPPCLSWSFCEPAVASASVSFPSPKTRKAGNSFTPYACSTSLSAPVRMAIRPNRGRHESLVEVEARKKASATWRRDTFTSSRSFHGVCTYTSAPPLLPPQPFTLTPSASPLEGEVGDATKAGNVWWVTLLQWSTTGGNTSAPPTICCAAAASASSPRPSPPSVSPPARFLFLFTTSLRWGIRVSSVMSLINVSPMRRPPK